MKTKDPKNKSFLSIRIILALLSFIVSIIILIMKSKQYITTPIVIQQLLEPSQTPAHLIFVPLATTDHLTHTASLSIPTQVTEANTAEISPISTEQSVTEHVINQSDSTQSTVSDISTSTTIIPPPLQPTSTTEIKTLPSSTISASAIPDITSTSAASTKATISPTSPPSTHIPSSTPTSLPSETPGVTETPLTTITPTIIDRSPTVTILEPQDNERISQIVTVKIHFLNVPSNMTMWIYVVRPGAQYYTDEIMPDNCPDHETCEQDIEIGAAVRTDVPYRLGILLADPPATANLRAHPDARDTLPTGVTKFSPIVVIRK